MTDLATRDSPAEPARVGAAVLAILGNVVAIGVLGLAVLVPGVAALIVFGPALITFL